MAKAPVRVIAVDGTTGETRSEELRPDSYVLVVGEHLELAGEQVYANGTRILTLKRRTMMGDGH